MATNQPTATIETITPETARQYLELNNRNRPVTLTRVAAYAQMMRRNQWILSGEPLIFNQGRLLNGQHRLLACISADQPFETFVVRDVPEIAFTVLDSGMTRSVANVLAVDGIKQANQIGSTTTMVFSYVDGKAVGTKYPRNRQDILEHVQKNLVTYENAMRVLNRAKKCGFVGSPFGALAVFVQDHQRFDEFVEGVFSGANLDQGDPRLTLRTWFMARHGHQTTMIKFCAIIKAWNAFVEGKTLAKMYAFTNGVIPRGIDFRIPDDLAANEDSDVSGINA
jgi:hypothetical protein